MSIIFVFQLGYNQVQEQHRDYNTSGSWNLFKDQCYGPWLTESWNIKGSKSPVKRKKILSWKREKIGIAMFQETYLSDEEHLKVKPCPLNVLMDRFPFSTSLLSKQSKQVIGLWGFWIGGHMEETSPLFGFLILTVVKRELITFLFAPKQLVESVASCSFGNNNIRPCSGGHGHYILKPLQQTNPPKPRTGAKYTHKDHHHPWRQAGSQTSPGWGEGTRTKTPGL